MRTIKPVKTDTNINRKLIIKSLGSKTMTINECIDKIFEKDKKNGQINDRDWRFYLHLNKLFCPMERAGLIESVGTKTGPTNRQEKTWRVIC